MNLDILNEHLFCLTQYQAANERLLRMRAVILGAQNYDGMPHASGVSDKTAAIAIAIAGQEEDVKRLAKEVAASQQRINLFCDQIQDNRCKLIFRLRFLSGMSWDEVAFTIGGGNTADTVRMAAYRYLQTPQAAAF